MSNGNCTGYQVKMSGFQTQLGHCVVFLGKALFSHSASLQLGVKMDTGKLWGGGNGRRKEKVTSESDEEGGEKKIIHT